MYFSTVKVFKYAELLVGQKRFNKATDKAKSYILNTIFNLFNNLTFLYSCLEEISEQEFSLLALNKRNTHNLCK